MKTLDYISLNEAKAANVISELGQLLADFHIYYMNLRGFHWNVTGHGFFVMHEKFESMYDDTASKIDEIAERILMLGGTPENKFSAFLKAAKLQEISGLSCSVEIMNNVLDTYKYFIAAERKLIDTANDANDAVTADLITGYIKEQEKLVWMLTAFNANAKSSCSK